MSEPGAGFDSRGLGLRAQKKLLGKMSSKKIVRNFIDDTTARVLDAAHRLIRQYKTENPNAFGESNGDSKGDKQGKKEADKLLKYTIKTVVKVGILYKNDQFNREELASVHAFKSKFHSLAMTVVSFYQVDFTYDRNFLRAGLEECRQLLQAIIKRHLTDKSKARIDVTFQTFCDPGLLDAAFTGEQHKVNMAAITDGLAQLMDEGNL